MRTLTKREWRLAGGVFGSFFFVINFAMISNFLKNFSDLRSDIASKQATLSGQELLVANSQVWKSRDAWMQKNQPKLKDADEAGVQLLDQIKTLAQKNNVTLLNPAIDPSQKSRYYQEIAVSVETRSPWSALIHFLYELQQPQNFIVCENVALEIDSGDRTQMHGHFKIARWYAP